MPATPIKPPRRLPVNVLRLSERASSDLIVASPLVNLAAVRDRLPGGTRVLMPGEAKVRSIDQLLSTMGFYVRPQPGGGEEIEQPFLESWVVYACATALASAVASVPIKLTIGRDKNARELPDTHPLARLLRKMNRWTDWSQSSAAGSIHRSLSGEDFWFLMDSQGQPLVPDAAGRIPMPAQMVAVNGEVVGDKRDANGRVVEWWYGSDKRSPVFKADSVVHFRDYDPTDTERGLGPAEVALRQLSIAFQAERYNEATFRGGGPGAFLSYEHEMDPAEEKDLQTEVDTYVRNVENTGGLKVLSGNPKVVPNPIGPKDMLAIDQMKWARDVVCSVFHVPPPIIGILDNATYSNIEECWRQFWIGIAAYLRTVESVVNEHFIPRINDPSVAGVVMTFDTSEVEELQKDETDKIVLALDIATSRVGVSFNGALKNLGADIEPFEGGDTVLEDQTAVDAAAAAAADVAAGSASAKAPRSVSRSYKHPPLSEPERREYSRSLDLRFVDKYERSMKRRVGMWMRAFWRAHEARWVDFAERGEAVLHGKGLGVARAAGFSDAQIEQYLMLAEEQWAQLLRDTAAPVLHSVFAEAARDMAQELGILAVPMTDPFVLHQLAAQEIRLSEGVTSTLAKRVKRVLLEALEHSSTTGDLQAAVREVLPRLQGTLADIYPNVWSRALTIARTEVGQAVSSARFMEMREAGVKRWQWITSNDELVRGNPTGQYPDAEYSHYELDGDIFDLGQEVPGHPRLHWPKDPDGQPGDIINCRCDGIPVIEE